MRILFFMQAMNRGGSERVASILSNALACDCNQVHILTIDKCESSFYLNENIIFSSINETKTFRIIKKMNDYLANNKIETMIAFGSKPVILTSFAKRNGVKIITSERTDPNRYRKVIRLLLSFAYHKSNYVVCPTNTIKDKYDKYNKSCVVIPNPIEVHTKPVHFKNRENKIVSVGRLIKEKDFPLLINAFSIISDFIPTYTLHIYGDGPEKSLLNNLIEQKGMSKKVFLMGDCSNIHDEICNAKLYVCSSFFEGFPNALFEAVALGIPVVSTSFPSRAANDYIVNGMNGFLVDTNQVYQMALSILRIVLDEQLQQKMSLNNIELSKKFKTKTVLDMWKDIIIH